MRKRSVRMVLAACLQAGLALAMSASPQDLVITVKEVEAFPYCAIAHRGPYTDMGTVISELVGAMQAQGLFAQIRGPLVGVYYNSPAEAQPADLSWEAGFVIAAQATTRPPLVKKVWKSTTVAAALHVGPYEETGAAIGKMMAWLAAEGYAADGPILERYLDQNPEALKPEELRTEIWIPCRKR